MNKKVETMSKKLRMIMSKKQPKHRNPLQDKERPLCPKISKLTNEQLTSEIRQKKKANQTKTLAAKWTQTKLEQLRWTRRDHKMAQINKEKNKNRNHKKEINANMMIPSN